MAVIRRFLVAPSLTRLIRKELGSERVIEGHFAPQSDRRSHIRIENGQAHLILSSSAAGGHISLDKTDLPSLHAEALLEVCPGVVTIERSVLRFDGQEALVEHFVKPGALDLVSLEFQTDAEAAAFRPLVWFGDEVTTDPGYTTQAIALSGLPTSLDAPLSNAALHAVLDIIEGGHPSEEESDQGEAADDDGTFDMLRRLAAARPLASLPEVPAAEMRPAEDLGVDRAEPKPRRPVLPIAPERSRDGDGDKRLAGVIEGLSEALSQSGADKENRSGSDPKAETGWRWSTH